MDIKKISKNIKCFEEIKQVLKKYDVRLYNSGRKDGFFLILESNEGNCHFYSEKDFNE